MKFKKILAAVISSALILSLGACSDTNEPSTTDAAGTTAAEPSTSNTLTIWAWDDNFNVKAANLAANYYKEVNPDVTVNVVSMAQDDIVQALNTALSSGTYSGLPNIVLIEDYRIQNYLLSYPGELKDLSGSINPADFSAYKLGVMTDGDKMYGVPFDSGVAALFYRTDYIEQAGYTKADMENLTWEKYIEIGVAVKEATGKSMLTLDPSDIGQIRMMLQSAGSWYVDADGKVDIENNSVMKEAIGVYKQIIDSGIATQITGWDSFVGAFQNGDVASVPTGCWIAPTVSAAADQSGKWAVAALPRLANVPESINASNIGGASWYVLDKVAGADTAEDFLAKTFASNLDLMNDLVTEINLVSTLNASSNCENYSKPNDFFGGQEIFSDFAQWTTQIPSVNYGLYTYVIEDIMTEAVQAILSGADMDETLKNYQVQAEAAAIS